MLYRSIMLCVFLVFPVRMFADMQMTIGPEDLLNNVTLTVDGAVTTTHNDLEVASEVTIDFSGVDTVTLRETNTACCVSYDFLGIPIPRAWWVSIEHNGQIDYLCDRNNVVFELPKILVTLDEDSSGLKALIEPERYCETSNRVQNDLYEPAYWQSREITINQA